MGVNSKENTICISRSVKWERVKGATPYIDNNFKNSSAVGSKSAVMHPEVKKRIELLIPHVKTEALFTIDGNLLTYRQIQSQYNKALKNLNLPFSSTHILRCGSATEFYNKTGNAALTQMQLGVTSMQTAQVYAKPMRKVLNDFYEGMYEQKMSDDAKSEVNKNKETV